MNTLANLRWLIRQMRPESVWQMLSLVCLMVNAGLSLSEPFIVKHIIDVLIPRAQILPLLVAGAVLVLVSSARLALGATSTRIVAHIEQRFVLRLKVSLLRHVNSLSADFHDSTAPGLTSYVIQESASELGQLSTELLGTYLRTLVLFVGTLATMFYLNVHLALFVLPLLIVFLLVVSSTSTELQQASEKVQECASRASNMLQEHLISIVQIKLLAAERTQILRAFRAWRLQARANYDRTRAEVLCGCWSSVIIVSGGAGVLCYGSVQVVHKALTIGGLVAFYRCLDRLFDPLYFSIDLNARLQRATANVIRIRSLLELKPSVTNPAIPLLASRSERRGRVAIENVQFRYGKDRLVINDVSLSVSAGERIAIVGPSGCGKSTIAKLIARMYDVEHGAVSVDGANVKTMPLSDVRNYVAYVPQRPMLFNTTIEDNLRYGNRWATTSDVHAAAQCSLLTPVVERLPRGWSETLGPSGELLSGGERQRVAIARALLRRPQILILDESTAELDVMAERCVIDAISRWMPETTLIIITHRLPAVSWVDRIVVMDKGKVNEIGPHLQLYEKNSLYTALFHQQNRGIQESTNESRHGTQPPQAVL